MAIGGPAFRQRAGSDNLVPNAWGVQPAGPLEAVRFLPSKQTVDYVHSLTQTTLLLIGAAVFVFLHRGRPKAALRKLAGRVT
jgi:hypothetical protein